MDPTELEAIVDRALARLPAPRAPRTLAPRVMQAVRLAEAQALTPARGWFVWPRVWQAVSLAAMLVTIAGGWYAWPALAGGAGSLNSPAVSTAASLIESARVIGRVLRPVMFAGVMFVAVMGALCAAGAAALRRVTVVDAGL